MKNNIYLVLLSTVLFIMLFNSNIIMNSVIFGMNITFKNVIPFLFPFFIIADLLKNYGLIDILGKLFYKPMNFLFNISYNGCYVFFLSLISGCPSNAKFIKELLDDNLISINEANKLLMFTHFSNPLFIIGTITLLLNKNLAILILISHYIPNIIIGLFIKNKIKVNNELKSINLNKLSFNKCLLNSISKNTNVILLILGVIVTFSVISDIILLLDINTHLKYFITGLLEITKGIKYVCLLEIPLLVKSLFITFFLSFGGISIHMQVLSILSDYNINYKSYLLSRLLHGFISCIIFILLRLV